MKFQKVTGQAIRIVGYLNAHPNEIIPSKIISQDLDISYQICIKISNMLKKGGLISTTRGIYGGFRLTKSAEKISLYDIVTLIEGPISIYNDLDEMPIGRGKKRKPQAQAYSVQETFLKIQKILIDELKKTTIADINF